MRYRYLLVFLIFFVLTFFLEGFTGLWTRFFFALFAVAVISLLYPTQKTKGATHE